MSGKEKIRKLSDPGSHTRQTKKGETSRGKVDPEQLFRENEILRRRMAILELEGQRFKATLYSIGDAVIATDTGGIIAQMNHVAEQLTGWPEAEALGRPAGEVFRIVNEEKGAEVRSPVARVLDEGAVVGLANHTLLIARDGSKIPIADSGAPIHDENGKVTGVVMVFRDQTKERAAEKALRESEESFKALAGNANDGILVAAGKGIHVFANKRAEEITGYSVDELAKISIKDLAHPDEFNERINERYKKILAGEPVPKHYETIIVRKDGKNVPVEVSSAKTNWLGQTADLVIIRDITERKLAEETLRISEARFSAVFQANPIGLSITRLADGQYVDVNDAFLSLFGYTREEALSHTSLQLQTWATPDERDRVLKILREQDRMRNIEAQYRRKSGEVWTALASAEVIETAGERYVLGLLQDITERKVTDELLLESNATIRSLVNATPESLFLMDLDGTVRAANENVAKRLGRTVEELESHSIWEVLPPEVTRSRKPCIEAIIRSGKPDHFEDERSGRSILNIVHPILNEQGRVSRVAVLGIDITDRKHAEDALRESESKFKRLYDSNIIGVIFWDAAGNILQANDEFLRIVGYTEDDVLSGRARWKDMTPPEYAYLDEKAIKEMTETGISAPFEKEYIRKDGSRVPIRLNAAFLKGEKNIGICFIQDISERKQAEEALKKSLEDLKRSNQELEQFAYVASHDLQEPLRMVSSYTQLLEQRYQDKLDQDAKDFIGYAVDGANRMQRLIQDLLEYSRVTTRGQPPALFDAHDALGEVIKNLQAAIQESGALVTSNDLPMVLGDRTQIVQVFQNLIGNGIKFQRPDVAPLIYISAEDDPHNNRFRLFKVSDNGIGIEPRHFERLFQIFQRLNSKKEYPGTGIGLALCKRIVERHGGRIWVESDPGKGATFLFTLPGEGKISKGEQQ
jgi:PAS domain S-box-containing protein